MKQRAPMRKKSKPRLKPTKLSPRFAGNADIEMGGVSVCVAGKQASPK
jgi:hypothetical protein